MSCTRSYCAESAAGMACNRVTGSGPVSAFCPEVQPPRKELNSRIDTTGKRKDRTVTGRGHLTHTGASFFAAQTSATIHPITLHPRKRLSRKIAVRSRLLRINAISEGRKYITKLKPKNGKKKKWAGCITA